MVSILTVPNEELAKRYRARAASDGSPPLGKRSAPCRDSISCRHRKD
jgi:hypothetical protein